MSGLTVTTCLPVRCRPHNRQAWDAKHRPPFLKAFGRFDPEGLGEMLASDVSVTSIA